MAIRLDHDQQSCSFILILGSSGSGKTSFVDYICGDTNWDENEPTTEVTLNPTTIGGQDYVLVDTPGLDNPNISDHQVFKQIKEYLITTEAMTHHLLAGVIYIHRPEDSLRSRTLHRNIQVVSHELLGADWYSRFRIMVPGSPQEANLESTYQAMFHPSSPFFHVLQGGAKVILGTEDAQLHQVLQFCASQAPTLLQVQQVSGQVLSGFIGDSIERRLGHLDISSVELHIHIQAERIKQRYDAELRELRSTLAKSKAKELNLSERLEQMEVKRMSFHDAEGSLRQQLEQTQTEYASLRSQLQLQENTEQGDVVRALQGLNREIEDIGRSLSMFLVDAHTVRLLAREPADTTTSHACRLSELKNFLGHREGSSSLVASSHGEGLGIEEFFDYAIRSTLCKYLHERIFSLFHPGAEGSESINLGTMYNGIRRREPQASAAKWRSTSFKSIYKHSDPDATSECVRQIAQIIVQVGLKPLTNFVFGEGAGVTFEGQHHARIEHLVRTAWEWNSMLKGDVLILGDFTQTHYEAGSRFNSELMTEFDARPGAPAPSTMLATLALGLDSSQAIGNGCLPVVTHVYKAVVATERALYG
ncbi:hypothetical protein BDV93DRAFT_604068 [Ceratobasidium sp. AG-I]|nr:hypothetical protein BDV93DRAFT_604068 [Ceratobasidium sp. AG-I]